jgi:hypothetical protein
MIRMKQAGTQNIYYTERSVSDKKQKHFFDTFV